MGGGGVYSLGAICEEGDEAGSVFGHSGEARARGVIFGWECLSLLRSSDQFVGVGWGGVAEVAAGAVWDSGESARCVKERSGWWGDAVREVFCQCGLVAAELSVLQRDLGDEEKGPAAVILACADEGITVSSDRSGGESGFPCSLDAS